MFVRKVKKSDIGALARLYYDTVHAVNAKDYSPAQIQAWAPCVYPEAFWTERFSNYTVFVAEEAGQVLGFAELGSDGHIDCFYVHRARQGQGVGSLLLDHIERHARAHGVKRLFADVSLTAQLFFTRRDFAVTREEEVEYRGETFRLCHMEKPLC